LTVWFCARRAALFSSGLWAFRPREMEESEDADV
jgi:hypothetical protein